MTETLLHFWSRGSFNKHALDCIEMRRQRREKSLNIHISVLVFVHQNYNFHVYTNRITGVEVKMYKVHKATFSWRTQGAVQESSDFQTSELRKCWSNPPWPCALRVLQFLRRAAGGAATAYAVLWFAWHSLKISWINELTEVNVLREVLSSTLEHFQRSLSPEEAKLIYE